ncbi:unnamed protein product [Victoria cruziana]
MELGAGARINGTVQVPNFTTKVGCFPAVRFPSSSFGYFKRHLQRHRSFRICSKDASISEAELKKASPMHNDNLDLSSLTAVSPLDGRYSEKVKELRFFFSEYGLIRYRVLVEVQWLLKLSQIPEVIEVPSFSDEAKLFLQNLVLNFTPDDALEVKKIEKVTNHDVKAVEYFLKEKCKLHAEVGKVLEFFHFACTSEDINNLAHGLMLRDAVNVVILPIMDELIYITCDMATRTSNISMLSRTHGQAASPTTLGKELAVFSFRLSNQKKLISQVKLLGKFAGAVGNYNAHFVAYPNIDWPRIAEEFVESLGISFNPYVTQRDLTDSTVLRNIGVGLGYSLLAYKSALQGIRKLQVNETQILTDLEQTYEVLAEPIQTVMRRYNIPEPYEKLKEMTRGRAVTQESMQEFVHKLELPEEARFLLLDLSPLSYVGAAEELAKSVRVAIDSEQ